MWDNSNGCKLAAWIEPTRALEYAQPSKIDRSARIERFVRDFAALPGRDQLPLSGSTFSLVRRLLVRLTSRKTVLGRFFILFGLRSSR